MESNIKNHLKALIQLSCADGDFGEKEKTYVYSIGKANGVPEKEIDDLVSKIVSEKEITSLNFQGLSSDQKFDFLYDVVQLMKIDGNVYLSEIRHCEEVAEKLGYDKKVVKEMSARIYQNPSITVDRGALMKTVQKKYLKE